MENSGPHHKYAVLGGGMLGLTIALRLAERGKNVTVIEAAPSLGGLTSTWEHENINWDRYYHVIEASDEHILSLLGELGLGDEIEWGVTNTKFFDGETLYPLNNVYDYLRLPTLGAIDKARLGLNILYGAQLKDGIALEGQSVEEWLVRWSGRRTFEKLWRPLLRGKLGDNFRYASAAYIWAVIQRFYGARQGTNKTELFGYIRGGYAKVIETIVNALSERGVVLEMDSPIQGISRNSSGVSVLTDSGERQYDQAIITFASPIAAGLCPDMEPREKMRHEAIRYQGIVCASILLKRPLGGAYLTYITDESIPFTTVIEMSSLVEREIYGGCHLAYLPKYVPSDDPLLDASDGDIERLFVPALERMFPAFETSDIVAFYLAKARYVTAISTINYSAHLPSMETTIPGVYICNSAQIVNAALSVNETVDLANRSVRHICR